MVSAFLTAVTCELEPVSFKSTYMLPTHLGLIPTRVTWTGQLITAIR